MSIGHVSRRSQRCSFQTQVLVMHNPAVHFNRRMQGVVLGVLHEFVRNRFSAQRKPMVVSLWTSSFVHQLLAPLGTGA